MLFVESALCLRPSCTQPQLTGPLVPTQACLCPMKTFGSSLSSPHCVKIAVFMFHGGHIRPLLLFLVALLTAESCACSWLGTLEPTVTEPYSLVSVMYFAAEHCLSPRPLQEKTESHLSKFGCPAYFYSINTKWPVPETAGQPALLGGFLRGGRVRLQQFNLSPLPIWTWQRAGPGSERVKWGLLPCTLCSAMQREEQSYQRQSHR